MDETQTTTLAGMAMKFIETQGVAVFILLIIVVIVWVWWLPEWKRQAKAREEQENARSQIMSDTTSSLVKEIHESRNEHREERATLMKAHMEEREKQELRHREDMREQRKSFEGIAQSLNTGLKGLSREVARNTGITIAVAEELGTDKRAIKDRANRLQVLDDDEAERLKS